MDASEAILRVLLQAARMQGGHNPEHLKVLAEAEVPYLERESLEHRRKADEARKSGS